MARQSDPTGISLGGMTINERLFNLGLLAEFDAAARRRDSQAMQKILRQSELSESDAASCVDAILADPKRYGF